MPGSIDLNLSRGSSGLPDSCGLLFVVPPLPALGARLELPNHRGTVSSTWLLEQLVTLAVTAARDLVSSAWLLVQLVTLAVTAARGLVEVSAA